MSIIKRGQFKLHSGVESDFKIDLDDATDEDIEGYAFLISKIVGPFGSVEGVPTGGLRLAKALEKYAAFPLMRELLYPHLIVDDVLTTGASMESARIQYHYRDDPTKGFAQGAVVFARGQCSGWIRPLFQLPRELWVGGGK